MNMKICPECKAENPIAANFCRKCRYKFPEATKKNEKLEPEIFYFKIKESKYVKGSKIHLEWSCDNYTKIEIEGKDVTALNSLDYEVNEAIELHLIAFNEYDQTEKKVKVLPLPLPNIRNFKSSHYNIMLGNKISISWDVDNAASLLLKFDDKEIDVTSETNYEHSPLKKTDYSLIAYSVDKNVFVESLFSVYVLEEVIINEFSSDIKEILESQPIELKWDVKNADKIIILPDDIEVTHHKSIQLYPSYNTTYRLVASNSLSEKEKILTIGVSRLPRFDIKLSDAFSKLEIPKMDIDFSPYFETLKETRIDRWLMSPSKQSVYKMLEKHGILKYLKILLNYGAKNRR